MPSGGKRFGAGRPRGSKAEKTRRAAEEAAKRGLKPLTFLLEVMADKTKPFEVRFEAATVCLPYCHPRLTRPVVVDDVGEMRDAPRTTVINVIGIERGTYIDDGDGDDNFPALELRASEAEVIVEPEPAVELTPDELEHVDLFS
jgi:hypothetical protein